MCECANVRMCECANVRMCECANVVLPCVVCFWLNEQSIFISENKAITNFSYCQYLKAFDNIFLFQVIKE
jgi:hypothetical protein